MDLLKKMPNGVLQACATFLHNFGHHFGHYHHYHQYNFEYDHHHLIRSPPHHEEHVFKAGSPFHPSPAFFKTIIIITIIIINIIIIIIIIIISIIIIVV